MDICTHARERAMGGPQKSKLNKIRNIISKNKKIKERNIKSKRKKIETKGWTCPTCTFEHLKSKEEVPKCEICGTRNVLFVTRRRSKPLQRKSHLKRVGACFFCMDYPSHSIEYIYIYIYIYIYYIYMTYIHDIHT